MSDEIGFAQNKFYILIPVFLNMILNLVYILLDILKFTAGNDKISSLDKYIFPVSITEILISLLWCLSGFESFDINKNPEDDSSTKCKTLACFQIFFYTFEILLIYNIISHLKHLIMNPLKYILKSKKNIIIALLIDLIISILITLISYFTKIIGRSPMLSCFYQYDQEQKIHQKIILTILLSLPLLIIIFSIYKIVIVIKSNTYESDPRNKKLFKAHIIYLCVYLLIFIILEIMYFTRALTNEENNLEVFTFVITLILVILPLINGLFKLYKNKLNASSISKRFFSEISEPLTQLKFSENEEQSDQSELFEVSALKKFVMNFYISVCFCLEKNQANEYSTGKEITDDMIDKTNNYAISQEAIMNELPNGHLINDSTVNSREKFLISCTEYAPKIFSYLRNLDSIDDENIIKSMLPMNNKVGIKETEGKGGAFFINTDDNEFIIKTITEQEFKIMERLLKNKMVEHFKKNKKSIICRIYGVYKLSIQTGIIRNEEIYFILMKNVIGTFKENLMCKYDLKGSRLNREVGYENVDENVLKDINFNQYEAVFLLTKEDSKKLLEIVENDASFLCASGIMDYSLLVAKIGLNNHEMNYLFGKDHRKKTEAQFLNMVGKERNTIDNSMEVSDNNLNTKLNEIPNKIDDENDKIRFNENNIASLRKYIFPSLKPDNVYIMSIIDYFQIYNLQKTLETKFKKLNKGVKEEDISSVPPDEYKKRFIEFVKRKIDSESYLQGLYDPGNKNDF